MLTALAIAALMTLAPEHQLLLQRHVEQNNRPDLSIGLFDKQAGVMASQAKYKDLTCGRRGGKTTTLSRAGLDSLQNNPVVGGNDESITPFIGPTKNHAKRLIWGRMQLDAKHFRIPVTFNNTDLIATHENGAQFWVMGADDDRDVQRLRGFSYRRVIIDEAQAIGADFEDLVDQVLDPALADYDGDLILSGTPNAACTGYFYKAATGQLLDDRGRDQWEHWRWTVLDNPYFPLWRGKQDWRKRAERWLEAYRRKKNWPPDHPAFLREWMAMWERDEGGLVVKYNPKRNHFDELPKGYHWRHVIGVDLGKGKIARKVQGVPKGNFALNVWAFSEDLPDVFSVHQFKKAGLEVSDWARIISQAQADFNAVATVADCGALGEAIVADISRRFGIPIRAAEKPSKAAAIDLLNSDLAARHTWVRKDSPLADEWGILQWDEDRRTEDPRFPNDLSDASLYGWREARHWAHVPEPELPPEGTREYSDYVAAELKRLRAKKIAKKKKRKGKV